MSVEGSWGTLSGCGEIHGWMGLRRRMCTKSVTESTVQGNGRKGRKGAKEVQGVEEV